eukprot:COSAG02_NODE_314_length_24915_cov_18.575596_28_plen_66_part_00
MTGAIQLTGAIQVTGPVQVLAGAVQVLAGAVEVLAVRGCRWLPSFVSQPIHRGRTGQGFFPRTAD